MSPLRRHGMNKGKAASGFRKKTSKTAAANLKGLQRGGWRL